MKLLALRCPACTHKLTPQNPDVVVLTCQNCGTGISISDGGLDTVAIQYAAPAVDRIDDWMPLWLFHGQVHIHSRQTQGGNRQAKRDSEALWGSPRRLYVPAWDLTTEAACGLGGSLVQQQPAFQPLTPAPQVAVREAVLSAEDALKLLEFIVLNVEAARQDWLKEFSFAIEAGPPQLWAVPAQKISDDIILQPLLQ